MNPVAVLPFGAALAILLLINGSRRRSPDRGEGDLLSALVPRIARERAERAIDAVGLRADVVPERLAALACVSALSGAATGTLLAWGGALVLVVPPAFACAGFLMPFHLLRLRAARRRERVLRELPDTLDLLAVCVGTGMALDPALRVATERFPGVVATEFRRLFRELDLGARRAQAYRDLGERLGTDDGRAASASLVQADALGLPLGEALADLAESMRERREQMAREHAARAAPRVQLVVALVVVPGAMILILGALLLHLAARLTELGALG